MATASLLVLAAMAVACDATATAATAAAAAAPESVQIGSIVQGISLHHVPRRHIKSSAPAKQQEERQLQEKWIICTLAGGTVDEADGKCRRCPDSDGTSNDRNCCTIDLQDFSLQCNVCEVLNGQESCGMYDCKTEVNSETTRCKGCIDDTKGGGTLCSSFTCPPAGDGPCICDSVRWNGKDCGECSYNDDGYVEFDCSGVEGDSGPNVVAPTPLPTSSPTPKPTPRPTPLPGAPTYSPTSEEQGLCKEDKGTMLEDGKCRTCVDGTDFYEDVCPACELIQEPQDSIDCTKFSCTDDYEADVRNCRGCLGSNICLNYDCPVMATDTTQCNCREFILEGRLCRSCDFDEEDGTLLFNCGNVGGPINGASRSIGSGLLVTMGASMLLGMTTFLLS